jgi:tripartite-type tricarboxylate transporter receptor subunit TctC
MKRRHLLQAASAAMAVPGLALAQTSYPNRSMRYIVPVSAGGGSDMIARVVTERWGRLLGQSFVVDNQSGGGGVVACQLTARAPADGYTLLQGYVATHGTTPATRRVNYDAVADFTPIGMIAAQQIQRAPADGYTLLVNTAGMMTITPNANPKARYQGADFTQICQGVEAALVLASHPNLGAKNYKELSHARQD